jgi:hypothetical protein
MPCRRPTSATETPGTHASATTRRFSSSVYTRRRTLRRPALSLPTTTVDVSIYAPKRTRTLLSALLSASSADQAASTMGVAHTLTHFGSKRIDLDFD